MYLDPNSISALRQLNNNFRSLLLEIAKELKDECNARKVAQDTLDKTTINLLKQDGMIQGIDLFLTTLNSLANARPESNVDGEY